MFLQNKYAGWYFRIVEKAQGQIRSKGEAYYESHHIIPQSLGGSNEKSNRVLLTAKEHFVAHALLCRMLPVRSKPWVQMLHAFMLMRGGNAAKAQSRYINAALYEAAKVQYASICSLPWKGKPKSEDHKRKLSLANTGRIHTQQVKQLIAEKARSRKPTPHSEERKAKISAAMKASHALRRGSSGG